MLKIPVERITLDGAVFVSHWAYGTVDEADAVANHLRNRGVAVRVRRHAFGFAVYVRLDHVAWMNTPETPRMRAMNGWLTFALAGLCGSIVLYALILFTSLWLSVMVITSSVVAFAVYQLTSGDEAAEHQKAIREARNISDALRNGLHPRDFAVYLRPFKTAGKLVQRGNGETVELEGLLALSLRRLKTVQIAIGNPGEYFGSGLLPTTDREWQMLLSHILREATLIVIVPGASSGTAWELGHVTHFQLEKAIFVMPAESPLYNWRHHWTQAIEAAGKRGVLLPAYNPAGSLFVMRSMTDAEELLRGPVWTVDATKRALKHFVRIARVARKLRLQYEAQAMKQVSTGS